MYIYREREKERERIIIIDYIYFCKNVLKESLFRFTSFMSTLYYLLCYIITKKTPSFI